MRRSLDNRMQALMDRLLPPGSLQHREYNLSPEHAAALAKHRRQSSREISRLEKIAPGASYEALLAGTLDTPEMPRRLQVALGLKDVPVITEEHTASEAAEAWRRFALGEHR